MASASTQHSDTCLDEEEVHIRGYLRCSVVRSPPLHLRLISVRFDIVLFAVPNISPSLNHLC